eukprot:5350479-Pyramimonas_sp.AAC.1
MPSEFASPTSQTTSLETSNAKTAATMAKGRQVDELAVVGNHYNTWRWTAPHAPDAMQITGDASDLEQHYL